MMRRAISARPYQCCHLPAIPAAVAAAVTAADAATDDATTISVGVALQLQRPQQCRGVANVIHIRGRAVGAAVGQGTSIGALR